MNSKPVTNHLESLSQGGSERNRPDDDRLRLLGKIIARKLLTKRSAHIIKDDAPADNPQTLADS